MSTSEPKFERAQSASFGPGGCVQAPFEHVPTPQYPASTTQFCRTCGEVWPCTAVIQAKSTPRPVPSRPSTDQTSPDGEVRTTSRTGGQKGVKLARFDLVPPRALRLLAEHYGKGAAKYADNQWRKGYEWSKSYAAMQRHLTAFWGGEDYDNHKPDCPADCAEHTGSLHLAAAMWHCAALIEFFHDFPDFDDRFRGVGRDGEADRS